MEMLRRFSLPLLLLMALPLLYLGAYFAWVAVDAHVLHTLQPHRTGFGPVEWMIDETPQVGSVLLTVGTEDMQSLMIDELLTRDLDVFIDSGRKCCVPY